MKKQDYISASVIKKSNRLQWQEDYVPGDMTDFRMRYQSQVHARLIADAALSIPAAACSPVPGGRCKQGFVRNSFIQAAM